MQYQKPQIVKLGTVAVIKGSMVTIGIHSTVVTTTSSGAVLLNSRFSRGLSVSLSLASSGFFFLFRTALR